MQEKAFSKWVTICGILLIWVIKFLLRPYVSIPEFLQVVFGIAPNLLGAILIPFVASLFFKRVFKLQHKAHLFVTCWFGLFLGIINEYLQLIPFFGRTFDYLDIIATCFGTFIGYRLFIRLLPKKVLSVI